MAAEGSNPQDVGDAEIASALAAPAFVPGDAQWRRSLLKDERPTAEATATGVREPRESDRFWRLIVRAAPRRP